MENNELILIAIEKQMEIFFHDVDERFFQGYCNCGFNVSNLQYVVHDSENEIANKTAKEADGFFIIEIGELVNGEILKTNDSPNSYKTYFFVKVKDNSVYFNTYNSRLEKQDIERFEKIGTLEFFENPDWIEINKLSVYITKTINYYTENLYSRYLKRKEERYLNLKKH